MKKDGKMRADDVKNWEAVSKEQINPDEYIEKYQPDDLPSKEKILKDRKKQNKKKW